MSLCSHSPTTPLAAALALVLATGAAAEIGTLAVSHVHQVDAAEVRVRAYLDLLNERGEPLRGLQPEAVSATLGEAPLELIRLAPLESTADGVAYIFLVDVSRSLSEALFERIRASLRAWIEAMEPSDRAAVIAFGERSRLVLDFTADRRALAATLAELGPTDDLTLLHEAIFDGLELAARRDPDLPGRRVLIVLTDGRDEGSGLADDDVLQALRGRPAPLYAVGFSQIQDPERRRAFLDLLRRFASLSGGAFYEADRTRLEAAYAEILAAVRRPWVAELRCAGCPADGRLYRFQATVEGDGRVLSDGTGVRILPLAAAATPAEPAVDPGEAATVAADAEPPAGDRGPSILLVTALAGIAALALLATLLLRRRRRSETATEQASELAIEIDREAVAEEVPQLEGPLPPRRLAAPVPPRSVRFVVVRGSRPGRQYRMILQERGVVGRRSTCDCVLIDEPSADAEQFELVQRGGAIYVRNLSASHPTLLDGLAIGEYQPVRSNDLLGTHELIVRILFD